jgi:hypothetical protein
MHKQLLNGTATLAAAAVLAVSFAAPAAARIECRGNFQVTKYGLISTPYCEEEQIARVARSYGARVTGAAFATIRLRRSIFARSMATTYG